MKKYGIVCPYRKANPYRRMMKASKEHTIVSNFIKRMEKNIKKREKKEKKKEKEKRKKKEAEEKGRKTENLSKIYHIKCY